MGAEIITSNVICRPIENYDGETTSLFCATPTTIKFSQNRKFTERISSENLKALMEVYSIGYGVLVHHNPMKVLDKFTSEQIKVQWFFPIEEYLLLGKEEQKQLFKKTKKDKNFVFFIHDRGEVKNILIRKKSDVPKKTKEIQALAIAKFNNDGSDTNDFSKFTTLAEVKSLKINEGPDLSTQESKEATKQKSLTKKKKSKKELKAEIISQAEKKEILKVQDIYPTNFSLTILAQAKVTSVKKDIYSECMKIMFTEFPQIKEYFPSKKKVPPHLEFVYGDFLKNSREDDDNLSPGINDDNKIKTPLIPRTEVARTTSLNRFITQKIGDDVFTFTPPPRKNSLPNDLNTYADKRRTILTDPKFQGIRSTLEVQLTASIKQGYPSAVRQNKNLL